MCHYPAMSLLVAPLNKRMDELTPLYLQLYQRIKNLILTKKLMQGTRLPSSRTLADELSLARNTVILAYEQLQAEGLIITSHRGSYVSEFVNETGALSTVKNRDYQLSIRGKKIFSERNTVNYVGKFSPGVPCISAFPVAAWRRSLMKTYQHNPELLNYGSPAGEYRLRQAIADHTAITRGVRCRPEQIFIVESASQIFQLCLTLLTDTDDTVWMEEPGYPGARAAMYANNVKVISIAVDEQGLNCPPLVWKEQTPRLIYTTPSHQYPTGAVMSIRRRFELIRQACQHNAIIIEDDYDSEFCYRGAPVPAMQGLIPGAPIIYIGTFSKMLFPSLRVAFAIFPEALLSTISTPLSGMLKGGASRHIQLALADFIERGHLATHIRKMRKIYRMRQQILMQNLSDLPTEYFSVYAGHGGMHVLLYLPDHYDDVEIVDMLNPYGLAPVALSTLYQGKVCQKGLILGFGNTALSEIKRLTAMVKKQLLEYSPQTRKK